MRHIAASHDPIREQYWRRSQRKRQAGFGSTCVDAVRDGVAAASIGMSTTGPGKWRWRSLAHAAATRSRTIVKRMAGSVWSVTKEAVRFAGIAHRVPRQTEKVCCR